MDEIWAPEACTLPTAERPFRVAEFDDLFSTHLQTRAREKLADVEAKLADLTVIAETLRAGIAAGCDDLETCAGNPDCPLPFSEIAQ